MPPEDTDSESKTVYCTSCGEEISANSNFCAECGAERAGGSEGAGVGGKEASAEEPSGLRHQLPGVSKNNTRRNVLVGVAYGIVGLGILGAVSGPDDAANGGGSYGSDRGTPTATEEQYPDAWAYDEDTGLVLREVTGTVGQFSVEISGTATNESGQDYSYVQLSFGLYDSTDAKVGDAYANTSGLDATQRWRFEAIGTETENIDYFTLTEVTAY